MASTIQVNLQIQAGTGATFPPSQPTFFGYLYVNGIFYQQLAFARNNSLNSSTAVITLVTALSPGNYTFLIVFRDFITDTGLGILTETLNFNDTPTTPLSITLSRGQTLPNPPTGIGYSGTPGALIIRCLHGSSLIQMKEGFKRLDQIKNEDQVITADNQVAKVLEVPQCWLSFLGVDHDAIIFEKDSISPGNPSNQLIIDPGHPICTQKQYNLEGFESLRPAGSYWEELKSDKIYTKKWTDVFVQKEPSVRYDLILEEPHNTYIANGIVIKSKYKDHRYKDMV